MSRLSNGRFCQKAALEKYLTDPRYGDTGGMAVDLLAETAITPTFDQRFSDWLTTLKIADRLSNRTATAQSRITAELVDRS